MLCVNLEHQKHFEIFKTISNTDITFTTFSSHETFKYTSFDHGNSLLF